MVPCGQPPRPLREEPGAAPFEVSAGARGERAHGMPKGSKTEARRQAAGPFPAVASERPLVHYRGSHLGSRIRKNAGGQLTRVLANAATVWAVNPRSCERGYDAVRPSAGDNGS